MNKFKLKGLLPVFVGLGIPIGLLLWALLVRWIWDSFFVPLGCPVLGLQGDAALALLILLVVGLLIGLKEVKK